MGERQIYDIAGEIWNRKYKYHGSTEIPADITPDDSFRRVAKAAAEKIEDEKTRERVLRRVRTEELSPRYMMLDLYRRDFDKKQCDEMIKAFVKDAEELGLKAYREGLPRTSVENRAETWGLDLKFGTPVEYL